ncbi:AAA family ATPase [bacterium]|nr:AAA family ATPase [bacterium]
MKCPICKKNIPNTAVKCPYCKTRTGLLCSNCNTVNPVGNLTCKKCGQELLKICSHCHSVNFPIATKCRKCGSPFGNLQKPMPTKKENNIQKDITIEFTPKLHTRSQAIDILQEGLRSRDKKIFSITGEKGIGKSAILKNVVKNLGKDRYEWCIGKCTQLTQLTPGGVVQDMLLNLFKLPNYYVNNEELQKDAVQFFNNEFRFLNPTEISDFLNFLYNSKDGNYEDIIINKKRTYDILNKIFDAFCHTGRFVFVIDNLDFIDGFSIEFLTNFMRRDNNWKNLKFIAIYNEHKPVSSYFGIDKKELKAYVDIHLAPITAEELEKTVKMTGETGTYVSPREKEVIFSKCNGNPAFVEQAISYCFDCQIADKAFLMPNNFADLIKDRLETLKKINPDAHKLLCGAAIIGDKLNLALLKQIFGYKNQEFNEIMSYLAKSNFVRPYNEVFYEFNNLLLWETILKNIQSDSAFEDLNVKIGRAISVFTLNTNAVMAMIAHNLKENRMAFDIWTKTTRLASYIGDINLYVISQKQCLALLNEFNENETLNIRYNISERLGKLLTEYDPEEAIEYLPDAISNAKSNNNEEKEIELLGYLALCCKKIGNYFGDVECVDNVLKKLTPSQELESAMIKASKLPSLLNIGNCGEVVNLVDNDIMPVINSHISHPRLNKSIPMGFLYDTWLRVYLALATALALQGNERSFEILNLLFAIIDKHKIKDENLICKTKLVLAWANTTKGNFVKSQEVLSDVRSCLGSEFLDINTIDSEKADIINYYHLIEIINKFLKKEFDGLQESLFESTIVASDTGNEYVKNIFKTLLGKIFYENKQAKRAVEIYNEEVTFFANKKLAIGALLAWYLIAEATIVTESPKNAIDIATQALEIAQNPRINNTYFIVLLKILLAKAHTELSDYESAKIDLESAIILAKKHEMNDLMARIYFIYGKQYQDLGTIQGSNQAEYLKGASKMYKKALDIVLTETRNTYIKTKIEEQTNILMSYCSLNGFNI